MLIRVNGRHDGVKRYLEYGQKKDREQSRDQLDERVVLFGDLELTDAVIQSIHVPGDVDRYLHLTMSFREDYVAPETIYVAVEDFRKFVFAAYRTDELNFYAEAHLPRLKSYRNRKDGTVVERKPHVHIVIPKTNLMTGKRADPLGYIPKTMLFIDAVQEQINAKHGFASPKDHLRTQLTGSSEMISRYRGDIFAQNNHALKTKLLDAVLDRHIETYPDFLALLAEEGKVRMRNAGRTSEYPNVKLAGEAKGINLKESVFSRAFIALSTDEKLQKLSADVVPAYTQISAPRRSSAEIDQVVADWMAFRARETKYLNTGNKAAYRNYQALSSSERAARLDDQEHLFYRKHSGSDNERDEPSDRGQSTRPAGGSRRIGRRYGFKRVGQSQTHGRGAEGRGPEQKGATKRRGDERHAINPGRPGARDAKRWERGARSNPTGAASETLNGLRNLSRVPVVRFTRGGEVLLPDHASRVLEHARPERADPLRRDRDSERKLTQDTQRWHYPYPRRGGKASPGVNSSSSIARFRLHRQARVLSGVATHPAFNHAHSGPMADRNRFAGRTPRATGRISDSAVAQRQRDEFELRRSTGSRGFFSRRLGDSVDAMQVLATLSHSHGVVVGKYSVVRDASGTQKIRAGSRDLDLGRFLTTELHLPLHAAASIIDDASRRQLVDQPNALVVRTVDKRLWREFSASLMVGRVARRRDWDAQRADERRRWAEAKTVLDGKRAAIKDDPSLTRHMRHTALSITRAERLATETHLRVAFRAERQILTKRHEITANDDFAGFLREKAQGGDLAALKELRHRVRGRGQSQPQRRETITNEIRPSSSVQSNEIIYRRPLLTHHVHENGNVTYRFDGVDVVQDRATNVLVTAPDRSAIEVGLRLGMAKYGKILQLAGSEEFKREAVRITVEVGLDVEFADDPSNMLLNLWRADAIADRLSVGFSARTTEVGSAFETARSAEQLAVVQSERLRRG